MRQRVLIKMKHIDDGENKIEMHNKIYNLSFCLKCLCFVVIILYLQLHHIIYSSFEPLTNTLD
jgi:hypothetical protein